MSGQAEVEAGTQESLLRELRSLRGRVANIHGSLVSTSDGLLLAHDIPDLEPTQVAALISAILSLAKQGTRVTGLGEFQEAVALGANGYLLVYAVGPNAVVAIIGDEHVNVALVRYEARETIQNIAAQSAGFARWSAPNRPQKKAAAAKPAVAESAVMHDHHG